MAEKRLLYITAKRLQAYSWKGGKLLDDGAFESGDEGVTRFAHYLGSSRKALYYAVPDVTEEDFFQENIPFVGGKDRKTLLGRKIAQRYRDTSLALAVSLGTQEGGRREDRILFSSFTNTQQFQPWLAALRTNEAMLVGVYSLALIAPLVAKRLKLTTPRYLMVSLQNGGMRQSYVEDGQIRFSRLGRADPTDPRAAAEACAAESNRILQYLINLRILPRETTALEVVAFAPAAHREAYESAWGDNPLLKLTLIDLESACRTAGLNSAPPEMLGERLFLHVLAGTQPAVQFASNALRRFYHLWRARFALLAGGTAVFAFSLLLSGIRLMDVYRTNNETEQDSKQETSVTGEYNRLQANFPKTPIPREKLKSAVGTANALLRQTTFPDRFFSEISQALAAVPQIEFDKIDWEISDNPRARATAEASKTTAVAGEPSPAAAPGDANRYFEVVVISAHINTVKSSDYRGIKAVVDRFVQVLRQRPGLEVISARTPFDAITEKAIAGDASEQERDDVPQFSITVSRRIGA